MTDRLKMQRTGAIILTLSILLQMIPFSSVIAAESTDTTTKTVTATVDDEPSYTKLRQIDLGTFNEYRYKLTEQYFALREQYNIEGTIDKDVVTVMADLATKGYRYLPDNLNNKNRYNDFATEIKKAYKYPDNDANYTSLVKSLQNYLESTDIKEIKGTIEATPKSGNAPLTVTLRAKVTDPTGTQIPSYNYIWWIDNGGKREVIGRQVSLNYTFREEGNFSVFLDVVSSHKNEGGYTDVLPFSSRTDIQVQEKIASLILKVNGDNLGDKEVLKFTPDDGSYGLIFDATSSTPTSGSKFVQTEWDFGNGVKRTYNGAPKIERIVYATEGEFTVTLKLTTNELKRIQRQFTVSVHRPIATINVTSEEGYIGDKVSFKAKPSGKAKDLTYAWEIIDIDKDEVLLKKEGSIFTYTFTNKGKFNVKLKVTEPSGDTDVDTKIIYINSRAPVAEFSTKVQKSNRPNTIIFDASKSYDPDYTDDGNLKFNWIIDGEKVNLESANYNGSVGLYTFDSVGDHSVALEVVDPDNITATKKSKVTIASILAVDLVTLPRVIQREQFIRFEADSKEASFYEWDFGDGEKLGSKGGKITHVYKKSGIFDVKVIVRDADGGMNTDTKKVYVGNSDSPVALLQVEKGSSQEPAFDATACGSNGAYLIDKISAIRFDAEESINIDGQKTGLTYSWKIGQDTFSTAKSLTHTFDEIGCFPVKLTVKSEKNGKTDFMETMVKVENVSPVLSSLQINMVDPTTDPVVVNVSALGAKDPDGVIQSYLWYYYTDTNNDPQDFRATTQPKTTFVLPKVTGNYYFVLVMKDNNEVKVNSEEIAGQRYSITLSGDNVNTPLVDLKVNDSSLSVGDPVVFTASAKNILGQDIGDKAEYYWDFDGDGFYDKQTKENSLSFVYQKSGEFFPKVKVKNKGFSNVRNIQVSVTNKIVADFEYISLGNTFIFLNTSEGKTDSVSWNFGDGNRSEGKETIKHTYSDTKTQRLVELTVAEGTKVKKITKKIVPDIKNIIKAKGKGLIVFSSPSYDDNNKITLEKNTDRVYIYLGESKGDIAKYGIDFDIDTDADLNGGKDDDEDNKGMSGFTSGDPVEIPLADKKIQKIRIFIKNESGNVLESMDLEIIQPYVEDTVIDPTSLQFASLGVEEKQKIEKVKTFISNLPESKKNEGMRLLLKLQEEWIDENERTKTILELETFFGSSEIQGGSAMVDILEGLLVTGQDDKSQKNIAFNALKSLLPDEIVCTTPQGNDCKTYLISQLELIKISTDVEANKKIGTDILKVLEPAQGMTSSEKVDFKAVLKTFVYGGVDNIPTDEKQEIKNETTSSSSTGIGAKIISILWYVFLALVAIIGLFVVAALVFWIYFKVSNKDQEIGFQDFIIKKTGGASPKVPEKKSEPSDPVRDILNETKIETPSPTIDVLASPIEPIKNISDTSNEIPDWLKGASDLNSQSQTPEISSPHIESPVIEATVPVLPVPDKIHAETPDLSGNQNIQTQETKKTEDWLLTNPVPSQSVETNTSFDSVPDWLKGAFDTPPSDTPVEEVSTLDQDIGFQTNQEVSVPSPQGESTNEQLIQNIDSNTIDDTTLESGDLKIPDWLKESFHPLASDQALVNSETFSEEQTDQPDETQQNQNMAGGVTDANTNKKRRRRKKKKGDQTNGTGNDNNSSDDDNDTDSSVGDDGLWADGMDVPDWLQDNTPTDDKK